VSERPLLPGEFAVLGLLAIRPMHGYEMARYFDRDDLIEVCPIEQSLLYTYVRNVEERGLVNWTEERVGARPPRKTYALTEAGRLLVNMWLRQPAERMREVRVEFLLKLYFLGRIDPPAEVDLLRRQIDVCDAYAARLAVRVADSDGFQRLVAQSKLSAAEATAKWLRSYAWEREQTSLHPGSRSK
jgi:DNA-binding PadR family transcriptional regulator